ncbi:MAG: selenocysteine-specific translation elongation factor [Acidobacteriia bacterium]|nr:selenocysteine-specific translation elongation factor [Terriglobia bacterium]
MKSVIVGTAGHIDHGKTALVKALTGIDADRLEEEKRRGITIDIGFAHLELPAPGGVTLKIGFVDVPGHERFVRNMLAGVGGIDVVMLVISADEGIKPQTREHFDICRLLQVRRGLTVLTKSDLVPSDTLDVVRLEVEEFLRGSFLDGAPIVPVSSITGAGLDELKHELAKIAAEVPAKDSTALFRLPIDRVFTMKGFGTVVTGTLISGSVKKEEDVEVFPASRRVRVRGVQVHGHSEEKAIAGQRTALNLAGVSTEELARGMMLAAPGVFRTTKRVDVSLSILPSAKALKDRARVHFHSYTAETIAEVVLYGEKQIAPGKESFAQLRTDEPLLLLPGDRFILRQFSPVVTIGGGVVVDPAPLPPSKEEKKRDAHSIVGRIQALTRSPEEQLIMRIARRDTRGLPMGDAIAETGWTRGQIEEIVASRLVTPEHSRRDAASKAREGVATGLEALRVIRLGGLFVAETAFDSVAKIIVRLMKAFHEANPLVAGLSKQELRERLDIGPELFEGVLDALVHEKEIEVAGEQLRLAGRSVVMKDEEAEAKQIIEQAFASAGLKVPLLKDVLAGVKVDKARAQKIVTLLLRDKVLVKISEDLVFHHTALEQLKRDVAQYKAKSPKIDVGQFKEMIGLTRKYAVPLLEWLDRERVTRRVGDERIIL